MVSSTATDVDAVDLQVLRKLVEQSGRHEGRLDALGWKDHLLPPVLQLVLVPAVTEAPERCASIPTISSGSSG